MKMKMLCSLALGTATVLSCTIARAQSDNDSDKKFLVTASEGDLAEMKLSQLAVDKSSNPEVKNYAELMLKDHAMLESKMKPFADKMGVPPADTLSPDHQAEYDKLSALSGTAFDNEYIKAMDMSHHMALMAFDGEIATTTMNDGSPFITTVSSGEKVVALHTKMADKLSKQMGIPVYNPLG